MEFERQIFIGKRVTFAVKNENGGAHFWVTPNYVNPEDSWGGVEVHLPPIQGQPPSDESCWLINGPCCHDGSSLLATERYIPEFHRISDLGSSDWGPIFSMLESFLDYHVEDQLAEQRH